MENEEVKALAVAEESSVMNLSDFRNASRTQVGTFSNIKDSKELYNLSNNADFRINDCVGEKIRFKKVLIRKYEKELPESEQVVNEETGEIIDKEYKVSCAIVSEDGKSYVTGSKTFTYKLLNYLIDCNGIADLQKDGIEIEIIKNPTPNGRETLGFKVL